MSSESRLPCFFDTLSNEILDCIFDFIPMNFVIRYGKKRWRLVMPQPLVLMHVSRRFRATLLHSERWLNFDFEFLGNLGGFQRKRDKWSDVYMKRYVALMSLLLDDPAVVACLSRKRDWVIPYLHGNKSDLSPIIVERIPNFRETARKLVAHFNAELLLTTVWPAVVELSVAVYAPLRADLTALSTSFPNVQYLRFDATRPWTGSLESFQHLVHLEVSAYVDADPSILAICDSLFPSQSAKSITYLSLGGHMASLITTPKFNLKFFHNLEHLELRGDAYACLSEVPTKLISLHLDGPTDVGQRPITFAHPCLSDLRSLRLRASKWDDGMKMLDMMEHIAKILKSLHHLILEYVVFDARRVGCLAELVQLKSLVFGCVIDKSEPEVLIPPVFEKHGLKPRIHIFRVSHWRWDSEKDSEYIPKSRFPDIIWHLPEGSKNVSIRRSYS
jgi:hypothetical protein